MKMKNKRIAATATATAKQEEEEERGKKSGKSAHCSFVIYDSVALNSVLRVRSVYMWKERERDRVSEHFIDVLPVYLLFGGFTAIHKAHSLVIIRNIVPYLHRIRYTREREILCGVVFNENEADVFFSFSLSSFVRSLGRRCRCCCCCCCCSHNR